MADLELKQGEAKTIQFTVTDSSGDAVDVSAATSAFFVKKRKSDTAALISKYSTSTDFTVTDATAGVISCVLNATNTDQTPGRYVSELTLAWSATNIDKSTDLSVSITQKVSS